MKYWLLGIASLIAFIALGLLFYAGKPVEVGSAPPAISTSIASKVDPHAVSASQPAIKPSPQPPLASATSSPTPETAKPLSMRIQIRAGQSIPEIIPYQNERDRIMELAATQDVKHIPEIVAFLGHSEPSVREAARQALIQLGDASAVPALYAAARSAKDPDEAGALREAAAYLELPVFSPNQPAMPASSAR